jgi:5'(3')-deoxyribonucleotidase
VKRPRILCDVDGVLADFVGLVLDYVQRNVGLHYSREAIDAWDCFAVLGIPEHWPYFRTQCDELQLCRSMRPIPGASEFYAALGQIGEVRVCTSPMTPAWLSQRAEWLVEFGIPMRDHIHAHDKHELHPAYDVLIDDRTENCEAFERAGGRAFCIATPYNANVSTRRGTHAECLAWLRAL